MMFFEIFQSFWTHLSRYASRLASDRWAICRSGDRQNIQRRFVGQWLAIGAIVLSLTGCVNYDIGINFQHQTKGEIVQHVRLSERLSALDQQTLRSWTSSLETRAKQLGGRVQRENRQGLAVIIPFKNGADLADKFDQFFGATETQLFVVPEATEDVPKLTSDLKLTQKNYGVVLHNDLVLDLDLRGLSVLNTFGQGFIQRTSDRDSFINLSFQLNTPWGATYPENEQTLSPQVNGSTLTWSLTPGEIQHIEVQFWLPSPIGIGAIVIVILVILGTYLKHTVLAKLFPKKHAISS